MRFFKHLSYRTLFTKAVMGISVICLFASDGLTASATTIKEENIAYNQSLAVQSNAVANWPTGPVISAESAILMDADSTTPEREITAMSAVPPPMSTTMCPSG